MGGAQKFGEGVQGLRKADGRHLNRRPSARFNSFDGARVRPSAHVVFGEADAVGLGVEASEHLLYEARLDASRLARLYEISDGRVDPGVLVDAEDDGRVLAH